jgi:hypothetical protein
MPIDYGRHDAGGAKSFSGVTFGLAFIFDQFLASAFKGFVSCALATNRCNSLAAPGLRLSLLLRRAPIMRKGFVQFAAMHQIID